MFAFLKALGSNHGKKMVRDVTDQIIAMDPATASAAQLEVMEQDLDRAGKEIGKLRVDAQRERREAVDAEAGFNRLLAAAENLNGQLLTVTDETRKASLNASLGTLVTKLEEAKASVETECGEADEAEALLAEAEQIYKEKGEGLMAAKKALTQAAGDLKRAHIQADRAEQMAESRARIAGLRTNEVGGLNGAVDAMKRQADDARAKAAAARMKVEVLSPQNASDEDPNIKAALAATGMSTMLGSPTDRLAALSGRGAAKALPAG